jgi:hypothetical protein
MRKPLITCLILILIVSLSGCSKSTSSVISPEVTTNDNLPSILIPDTDISNHNLGGIWSVEINADFKTIRMIEYRDASLHFNVTRFIPSPQIVINGYEPSTNILDVDVTITNPYPVDVYDVRLIIFTDSAGHKLINDDGWTTLYDIPSGLPINPFKAYVKDIQDRKFAGNLQYTENLQILLPGGNTNVTFAIDASYPGNCEEPYKISDFTQDLIFDFIGSSTSVQVDIFDWQDDVSAVNLYCPAITGTTLVAFSHVSGNIWELELVNNTGAAYGEYEGFIQAASANSGTLALYDNVKIDITHSTGRGWARTWGGYENDRGICSAVDNAGNIFVSGYFSSIVDFDPGPGDDLHTSNGMTDIFLSKFDKDGNFMWAKTWGGTDPDNTDNVAIWQNYDLQRGIDTDSFGSVYLCGNFMGEVDFDPGIGEAIFTSNGGSDSFLIKLDQTGKYINAMTWGGTTEDNIHYHFECTYDLTFDLNNDIYITGAFTDTADLNPGEGVKEHISVGNKDIYLIKLNSEMAYLWSLSWGGNTVNVSWDNGYGVTTDDVGNVYVTGDFGGTGDFDPGQNQDFKIAIGRLDAFLSKFSSDGNYIWSKQWGGIDCACTSYDVILDEFNNVYIGGRFSDENTVDFDPGLGVEGRTSSSGPDAFIVKLNKDGSFNWVTTWGNIGVETCLYMKYDKSGHIYASSRDDVMPLLIKFDLEGNLEWNQTWGNPSTARSFGLDIDQYGDIFITGYFNYAIQADFDPGPGRDMHGSAGEEDVFLVKLLPNGYWE